jgi:tRNA(Ile)-lysidine synthase
VARLLHGAGTEGLAGLPPREESRIRPLIEARRAETRAYCAEVGLDFIDDPANDDERFERPAVRKRLVAPIEERWGEGAVKAMAHSAERLRVDAEALAAWADESYDSLASPADPAGVALPLEPLLALPRALRARLLERAVGRVRDRSGGIEAALDALDEGGRPNARFAVASGIEIRLEPEQVRVTQPAGGTTRISR